jgi:hypothetical protein
MEIHGNNCERYYNLAYLFHVVEVCLVQRKIIIHGRNFYAMRE